MSLQLDVRFDADEVQTEMSARGKRARDLSTPFRVFDRDVGQFFRKRFETAGKHGGGGFSGLSGWKELSEETKERRRKPLSEGGTPNIGGVKHPLWDTGNLKASFQEVGGESVRNIERDRYIRGSRVPYAIYHQEGRGVPKREIVPDEMPRFMMRRLTRLVERWVADGDVDSVPGIPGA